MTLLRLLARRYRTRVLAGWVVLVALILVTVSSYQSTYPTAEGRQVAVDSARRNGATTVLYGALSGSGNPAQMFSWEMGAIVTIMVAAMAVLLTINLVRVPEDDGTLELLRATGLRTSTPLACSIALLAVVSTALGVGCVAALAPSVGEVVGVTWPGVLSFGGVIGMTFFITAMLTTVIGELAADASAARVLGSAALGAGLVLRAIADVAHLDWLGWLSPLALRAVVLPFSENRWPVLGIYLLVSFGLGWAADRLSRRRDVGAGLLTADDHSSARLHAGSPLGLSIRLERRAVLVCSLGLGCFGGLFAALGSGVVTSRANGDLGNGFLASQLATGDPVAAYFGYAGTFVGIVVSTFTVATVLRAGRDEGGRLTDHILATGARRWAPLGAQLIVAAAGTLLALLATGALVALVGPAVVSGSDVAVRGFGYVVGQWPATLALGGLAALVVGLTPRQSWLAWLPLAISAGLALLGALVGLPVQVREMGAFQHTPDLAVHHPEVIPMLVLAGVGVIAALAGMAAMTRRDVGA